MRWPVGDQRGAGGNVRGSRYRVRRRKGWLPREVGPCRGQRPAPFWGEGGVLTAAPGMGPASAHPFLRQDAAHQAAGDGDAPPPDGRSQRIQAPLGLRVGMPKVHLPALQRPIWPGGSLRVNAITTPRSHSVRRRVRPAPSSPSAKVLTIAVRPIKGCQLFKETLLVGHAAFKAGIAASVCRPQQPATSHSRVRYEDAFWPSPKPVLFAA